MNTRSIVASILSLAFVVFAAACSTSPSSPSTVSAVVVTGTAPGAGSASQFVAMATLSDGSTQDVTSVATWSSSNASVATVSSTGLVTAVGSGTTTIAATDSNVVGSTTINEP